MQADSKRPKAVIASRGSFWGKKTPRPDLLDEEATTETLPVELPVAKVEQETEPEEAEVEAAVDVEEHESAKMTEAEVAPEADAAPEVAPVEDREPEADATPEADQEPEAEAEPETDAVPEVAPVEDREPEADQEADTVLEADRAANATPEAEAESEADTVPEVAPEAGPEPEVVVEPSSPKEDADELTPVPEAESEPEAATETTPLPEPNPEAAPDQEAEHPSKPIAATPPAEQPKAKPVQAKAPQAKRAPSKQDKPKPKTKSATAKRAEQKQEEKPPPASPEEEQSGPPLVRTAKSLWTHHRMATILGMATCAIILIAYIAGGVFFSSHFLPRTTVNGNDVSMLSTASFTDRIASEAEGYTALVSGNGTNFSVTADDVNLSLDIDAYVKAAASQVPSWLWPFAVIVPQAYTVEKGVTLDEGRLSEIVSPIIEKAAETATPTTNASIYYDEETGGFKTVAEKLGTELDTDAVLAKVANGMEGLNPTITLGEEDLVQPTVTLSDSEFKDALAAVKKYPNLQIELLMGGETVKTLDNDLIRSWLRIADDFSITGDVDAVALYTRGTLSSELDSVAGYRTYTRPDGKQIQINDGTYGWNIDGATLADLIVDRIENKSSDPIEIPCISSAAIYNPGGADWGKRYIDVDLTEQFARMYGDDGSLIWSSECVSGGPAEGNDTVTGVFAIEGKESPATLIGLDSNGDGEPDYENEVTYWMPFFGGYGLHDATWRYTFGGDEYLYDGSHGCVNLPYNAAEMLYFNVRVGDAVIVHW